jgi:hypothetical protein
MPWGDPDTMASAHHNRDPSRGTMKDHDIGEWTPVNRFITLPEAATAFDVDPAWLRRAAARAAVRPALRIGRMGLYGPMQIRRLYELAGADGISAA